MRGIALEGSNQEKENLRYWLSIGSYGFFEKRSLSTAPHVVVLVFDIMLRSLQKMISSVDSLKGLSPQLELYCNVIQQATNEGLDVYIALTHLDLYEEKAASTVVTATPNTTAAEAVQSEETRIGETFADKLSDLSSKLSRALAKGGAIVPCNRIFVVENYRARKNICDPRIELAALELLDALVDSADAHLVQKCKFRKDGCVVA